MYSVLSLCLWAGFKKGKIEIWAVSFQSLQALSKILLSVDQMKRVEQM